MAIAWCLAMSVEASIFRNIIWSCYPKKIECFLNYTSSFLYEIGKVLTLYCRGNNVFLFTIYVSYFIQEISLQSDVKKNTQKLLSILNIMIISCKKARLDVYLVNFTIYIQFILTTCFRQKMKQIQEISYIFTFWHHDAIINIHWLSIYLSIYQLRVKTRRCYKFLA